MAAEARAIEADIPMGMTQIGEGEAKVLLVRDANGLRAFQATCPFADILALMPGWNSKHDWTLCHPAAAAAAAQLARGTTP